MFNFFQRHYNYVTTNQARSAGNGLLFNAIICILFGLAILANPELLAFLVASFFLILGATMFYAWWKLRRWEV